MMSRGDGGNPRQERKRKSGGKKKQGSSGTGSPAGWKANTHKPPHRALAGVDPALLRDLRKWGARKTFTHQFRVAAARPPAAQAPPPSGPPVSYQPLRVSKSLPPGLAAVKYAQQQREMRGAVLAQVAHREQQRGPGRGNNGPSSLGELYVRYKAEGRLAEFFSLFPR